MNNTNIDFDPIIRNFLSGHGFQYCEVNEQVVRSACPKCKMQNLLIYLPKGTWRCLRGPAARKSEQRVRRYPANCSGPQIVRKTAEPGHSGGSVGFRWQGFAASEAVIMFRPLRPFVTIITAHTGLGLSLFWSGKRRRQPLLGSGEDPAAMRFFGSFCDWNRSKKSTLIAGCFWDDQ